LRAALRVAALLAHLVLNELMGTARSICCCSIAARPAAARGVPAAATRAVILAFLAGRAFASFFMRGLSCVCRSIHSRVLIDEAANTPRSRTFGFGPLNQSADTSGCRSDCAN
jgi:hypothetical protein